MSFHNNYNRWKKYSAKETCPVCNNFPQPDDIKLIKEFQTSWLEATPNVCLKGTCYLMIKPHAVEIFDINENDLLNFMKEIQLTARALKKITGAIKINYEIHGNTIPHLHMHLFPRYRDDPFAGVSIDYNRVGPPVYKENEFSDFISRMKNELKNPN